MVLQHLGSKEHPVGSAPPGSPFIMTFIKDMMEHTAWNKHLQHPA